MTARRAKSAESVLAGCFGFDPAESVAHFLVDIPAGVRGDVFISEHLSWDEKTGSSPVTLNVDRDDGQARVKLARSKWDEIADAVRVELNQRLRKLGKRPGRWKTGHNLVARLLGKELTLLGWAIEDADPALIPVALANWRGLTPEERWWLYTMTAAATGNFITGRGRGWRKAVRYALTENPVSGVQDRSVVPEFFQLVSEYEQRDHRAAADEGSRERS